MGTAAQKMLTDVGSEEVVDALDRLWCYEQLVRHWCEAVEHRLTGFGVFLVPTELRNQAALATGHATRLAARVNQLGGVCTADPTEFVERSPIDGFDLPADLTDPMAVLADALAMEQDVIARYARLISDYDRRDVITHQLLIGIATDKTAREDELEAVMTRPTPEP